MSIPPPFLSTTPPPPDKCEDREHDEYDTPYSLSQEDDFDDSPQKYGSPQQFNNYKISTNYTLPNLNLDNIINSINNDFNINHNELCGTNDASLEEKVDSAADIPKSNYLESKNNEALSDLSSNSSPQKTSNNESSSDTDDWAKSKGIDELSDINTFQLTTNFNLEEEVLSDLGLTINRNVSEAQVADSMSDSQSNLSSNEGSKSESFDKKIDFDEFVSAPDADVIDTPPNIDNLESKKKVIEPDFGFFQTDSKEYDISGSKDGPQFSFNEEIQVDVEETPICEINVLSSDVSVEHNQEEQKNSKKLHCDESDDEFGDFDAYRSNELMKQVSKKVEENKPENLAPSLDTFDASFTDANDDDFDDFEDFKTSDSNNKDLLETFDGDKIEAIWKDMFGNELYPVIEDYKGHNIEYLLSTMWNCLKDVDARQPYIVNWDRSNAQQFLLRSLKIDQSSIMSLPRINPNMPKYAANLSSAPLQPMKPSNTTSHQPITATHDANNPPQQCFSQPHTEKHIKAMGNQPPPPFDQTTLLQPTQISLPETHIFTPTNSVVPTSQTMHHDIPAIDSLDDDFQDFQSTITETNPNFSIPVSSTATPIASSYDFCKSNTANSLPNDVASDSLDDFKSSAASFPNASQTFQPKELAQEPKQTVPVFASGIDSILQPMKVESAAPTLNWPDPGDINSDPFGGFNDFVTSVDNQNSFISRTTSVGPKSDHLHNEQSLNSLSIASVKNTTLEVSSQAPNARQEVDDFDNFKFTSPPPTNGLVLDQTLKPKIEPLQPKQAQILQPLSLEGYSSINWPSPGLDIQDLSRFNPVNVLPAMKSGSSSKTSSPLHQSKKQPDEDWGDFVSTAPTNMASTHKMAPNVMSNDDSDDWSDFVCSAPNGINTISYNVSSFSNATQKSTDKTMVDVPKLNFITPKNNSRPRNDLFQNL